MKDLLHKIDEMKLNLNSKDIKSIKKSKLKTISTKEINKENKQIITTYNYYVKLIKKLKKYLKTEEDIILEVKNISAKEPRSTRKESSAASDVYKRQTF